MVERVGTRLLVYQQFFSYPILIGSHGDWQDEKVRISVQNHFQS